MPRYYLRTALCQTLFKKPLLFHNVMNDCTEVDGLLLNLAGYKNDYADMAAVKLLKSARPVGKLSNICKTACTTAGCLRAPDSRCWTIPTLIRRQFT